MCPNPRPKSIFHCISTYGNPVWACPDCLPPEKLAVAWAEFDHLQQLSIICPSRSQWSSLLHMAHKFNHVWRPWGDYRHLNMSSSPDHYPIPHTVDFTIGFSGACIFPKVDLVRGYHQISVHPKDIERTAITTPFGLWESLRLLFSCATQVKIWTIIDPKVR